MRIEEILKKTINRLIEANIEEPILKSKILVANALGKGKEYLIINGDKFLKDEQVDKINKNIKKVVQGLPIQYITNSQEFMELDFFVDENVLIPQPDTENLVEETLRISTNIKKPKILDLCTGSGAIAVSLAKHLDAGKILATDISKDALSVAKINCNKNNVGNIELLESDLFNNINEKFNIIVSNPPYIETSVIETLSSEVKSEPKLALDGGEDGLDFYRRIINEAHEFLEKSGYLCLEIGYNQKEKVINFIKNSKKYCNIYSKKDLAGNDRIVICQNNNI